MSPTSGPGEWAAALETLEGVKSVDFDGSEEHYQSGAALFDLTYDGAAEDQVSPDALERVKETLSGYDVYITGDTGASDSAGLDAEMRVVMVVAVAIILLVLLFTSHTYMEIPVLLMTFGMAALMNKGTNFMFGEISFVSNSVAVVLQLALAIDYAIVIANRYTDLKKEMPLQDAVVESLNEAFPTIITSGSILASAGVLIGFLSSSPAIASIGVCLGRGTLISIFLVMAILPQNLLLGDFIIEKTAITLKHTGVLHAHAGAMRIHGHVRGYVPGIVDADFTGSLVGTLNVSLEGGSVRQLDAPPPGLEPPPESGPETEREVARHV